MQPPPVQLKPANRPSRLFPANYRRRIDPQDLKVLAAVIASGVLLVGVLVAGGVFVITHPEGFIPKLKKPARPVIIETEAEPR